MLSSAHPSDALQFKGRPIFLREDREAGNEAPAHQAHQPQQSQHRGGSGGSSSVYVGGLSYEVVWQQLKDHMKLSGGRVSSNFQPSL